MGRIAIFRIEKLVRTGILRDAQNRRGHVFGQRLTGKELTRALELKLQEEVAEFLAATTIENTLEEAADIMAVLNLAMHQHQLSRNIWAPRKAVAGTATVLIELANSVSFASGAESIIAMAHVTNVLTGALARQGHTMAQVKQAYTAKSAAKGPLEGWYLNTIVLPEDDEWVGHFRSQKRPELPVPPNLDRAIPPEVLAA